VPQPIEYHQFVDQRTIVGVPHFWNVVSNLPFAVVGLHGCWWPTRRAATYAAFGEPRERTAYLVFFAGDFLTCCGRVLERPYCEASDCRRRIVCRLYSLQRRRPR
jgi:hypothetical protein